MKEATQLKPEFRPCGFTYSPDEPDYLCGAVMDHKPCGCEVIGNGTLPSPLRIKYCSTHKAAEDLLLALEAQHRWQNLPQGNPGSSQSIETSHAFVEALRLTNFALSKAKS
jgi:hypothetical protein